MKRCVTLSREMLSVLTGLVLIVLAGTMPAALMAQNPNSETTSTGQVLSVNILSPENGASFDGPDCTVPVEGQVTLSRTSGAEINVIYLVDVSISTEEFANFDTVDTNADGVINANDDWNGDGVRGSILDAEIAAIIALNESIRGTPGVEVGLIAFGNEAVVADMDPFVGTLDFAPSPGSDLNSNGILDMEEVARSLDTDPVTTRAGIGRFTDKMIARLGAATDYDAALNAANRAFAREPQGEVNIIFFLSDGIPTKFTQGPRSPLGASAAGGVLVNTFGILQAAQATALQTIASETGARFTAVQDPSRLSEALRGSDIGIATVTVNGNQVDLNPVGGFATELTLTAGNQTIAATAVAEDQTSVTAGIAVVCGGGSTGDFTCNIEIVSPPSGSLICGATTTVKAVYEILGEFTAPLDVSCTINGIEAQVVGDTIVAEIPVTVGLNLITVECTFTDAQQQQTSCSITKPVIRPQPPACLVEIITPSDSSILCGSVKVTGFTTITSFGVEPFEIICDVNGVPATVDEEGVFMATIDVNNTEETEIVATCTIIDSCGVETVCTDTIRVFPTPLPVCTVEILTPSDEAVVCGDSIKVTGFTVVTGGAPITQIQCDVNGVPTTFNEGGEFMAMIPLIKPEDSDLIDIVATCTVIDTCERTFTCRDTITVCLDDVPPVCDFSLDGFTIFGAVADAKSGIDYIEPLQLDNVTLTVDEFERGDKQVFFTIEVIDPNRALFFNFLVADTCGNTFECDPIFVNLPADSDSRQRNFSFPIVDRYFELTNRGLSEVRVDLNGKKFSLFSDAADAAAEPNAYPMPVEGVVTIDLLPYLNDDINNMVVVFEGGAGSDADLFIYGDPPVVDFVLEIEAVPTEFQLAPNYPNPFNPTTNIRFDIPERLVEGTDVSIRIYNLLGAQIRVLVDEHKSPGQYTAVWDGKDKNAQPVASGIYIYQLVTSDFRQTRRMLLLK